MKKLLFVGLSALLLAGCGDKQKETSGDVEGNKTEETVETKGLTQDELNAKLKEEAVEADYKELNSDNAPDKKKVFVKGEIGSVFEEGILGTFILNNENGIYTVNLLSVDEKYEAGDNVTVYGTTNGKDETGNPQITATILEHNEEKTETKSEGPLTKVGQSIDDEGVGTVTLDKIANINKEYETGGLKIKVIDAKVLTITDVAPEFKENVALMADVQVGDEFTYLQVRYNLQNTTEETVIFNGFETAVPDNGNQIDINTKDLVGKNPNNSEILHNASVDDNLLGIPVDKGINSIRLMPSDVLYDNDDLSIFYPKEITIEF
ncbi:hypothetical protein [Bacillus sp. ISL-57]|uniref:hypothetical protein n=1 Tax=Bacillus sp. ISL-57 TaxID=2819135 RepID=UPI001BE69BCF|nr:hypothetical protein [Bacillus sp. ISL-57]MBT2717958.1 hypothetical protein [Bacillus sp. ISL-57]